LSLEQVSKGMAALSGKVAIVTGAAVGIGSEIARALGAAGAAVGVNYSRSREPAEDVARSIIAAGGNARAYQADVGDDPSVRSMVAAVEGDFGRIDILINNAGITSRLPFDDLDALTDELWDRLYSVNVKGKFHCARAVAPAMRKHGNGRIINISSVAGIRPTGSSIAYCASKAALNHVSDCLAKVLAPAIRVNSIAPGFVDQTRWNDGVADLDKVRASAIANTPLKRLATPADITEAVMFFVTATDFMTGAMLVVDGGRQFYQ
jgi:3-oxoacyl-[acyl-carrier protein] reductase